MDVSLVLANLAMRPARTLGSILGVAIGVVLIVVTAGLGSGMLASAGRRESNIGAELLFQPPGSFGAGVVSAPLSLPVAYGAAIQELEGVHATTPVGRYVRSGARGIGFELVEGVVFEGDASYPAMTGITARQGRMPAGPFEATIDHRRAEDYGLVPGSEVEILGHQFVITGVFEPEVGARIKLPLETLQSLLGAPDKCSWVLVKVEQTDALEMVAHRIEERFPGNQIIFTRDIPGFYERGMPSLTVFLRVVVGLAIAISSLITLLAMYTAVTERTREIGILKALGASRRFIVTEIQKEALVIGALGVVAGLVISVVTRAGIARYTSLIVSFEPYWILLAGTVGLFGSALGALYPAVKAAKQDAIQALAYE